MTITKLALIAILACVPVFADPPVPEFAPAIDAGQVADSIRRLERQIARLERLQGLKPPRVRIVAGIPTTLEGTPFVSLACEVANPNDTPLMFEGYRSDSFEPPLGKGQVSPIHLVQLERDGKWVEYPQGWCGWGIDGIELAPNGGGTFGFAVPITQVSGAVRVGIRWSRPFDFKAAEPDDLAIAWSEPFTWMRTKESKPTEGERNANEPVAPPGKEPPPPLCATGGITHGKPDGGLAAFLICDCRRFKVNQSIALSHGVICTKLRTTSGNAGRSTPPKIAKPKPAVDPHNASWFTGIGPEGQELSYVGEFVRWPAVQPEDEVVLKQGELVGTMSADLQHNFDLRRPGKYRVRWKYGWNDPRLVSNEIQIEIVE